MSGPRPPVASIRLQVSDAALRDAYVPSMALLRELRLRANEKLDALEPGMVRQYCFSKVRNRVFDLTVIASPDHDEALRLATKLRTMRRRLKGYRTEDEMFGDDW